MTVTSGNSGMAELKTPTFRIFQRVAECILALVLCCANIPVYGQTTNSVASLPPGNEAFINFNFDQVDIRFLVKLVGELTGKKFVIEKGVDGKITVSTPPQLPISEIYPLFLSILEAGGCALVEKNGISYIVQREARLMPVAPVMKEGSKDAFEGIVTKVIRLTNISASELRKAIEPMVDSGKTGAIGILEASNHLIITDTIENIRRIESIVEQLDRPGKSRVTEIVALKFAEARNMADELNQAIAGGSISEAVSGDKIRQRLSGNQAAGGAPASQPPVVVAVPHANGLILVGTPDQITELKALIAQMDIKPDAAGGRLQALYLKYLTSDEAAKSLMALLSKRTDKATAAKIAIEPSLANNALLIDAEPQDFAMIKALMDELDTPPNQVLVEVLFAEVQNSDGSNIGVEFMAAANPAEGSTMAFGGMRTADGEDQLLSQVMNGVVPNGLSFGLSKGTYTDASGKVVPSIPALINVNALQMNGKVKILSNIPLWAQNNQQASVSIVKNIPVLKSTIQGGSGSARDVIQNIDRVDVGIKLTVTPHVNPNDEVLMKLNPSIEAIVDATSGGLAFTPTIAKREVTTTLTVSNGRTIVISGLMREDMVKRVRKIPFFGSIPLIGWLFRSTVEETERTNLLIFVTPHVVKTPEQAQLLRQQLEARNADTIGSVTNAITTGTATNTPPAPVESEVN